MVYVALVMVAGFFLSDLYVQADSKERSTALTVSFSFPNSTPEVVEGVTAIIENACSQLRELKHISSTSSYHGGFVQLYFDPSAKMAFKRLELATLIRRIYRQLPAGVSFPYIGGGETDRTAMPILVYAIHAQLPPQLIREESETIFRKAFADLKGVKDVTVSGVDEVQMVIQFDREKCLAWHVSPNDILPSLNSFFGASYPGYLTRDNHEQYFLRVPAPKADIGAIEQITIPSGRNSRLLLKDIAGVYLQRAEPQSYFRINGKNVVRLSVYPAKDVNKVALAGNAQVVMEKATQLLPKGFAVSLEYDDTSFLSAATDKSYGRLLGSLVLLVMWLAIAYRDWRMVVHLLAGLLLTFSLTVIIARLLGATIHLYTMGGIAVAVAIVMDNGILMLDYYRTRQDRRMFLAMCGASLISIFALWLVGGYLSNDEATGGDFPVIVIISLVASLITAVWCTPALCTLLRITAAPRLRIAVTHRHRLLPFVERCYQRMLPWLVRYRKLFIVGLVLLFGTPVFLLPDQWRGTAWYHKAYNHTLGNAYYLEHVRPAIDKCLGGTLRLFVEQVYNKSSVRDLRKTKLYLQAELPIGSTPAQMNRLLKDFEEYLSTVSGVDQFITNVYSGQFGFIEISFTAHAGHSSLPYQLKAKLIGRSLNWGGVKWSIYGIGQGFSNGGEAETPNFKVVMKGYNYDELEKQAIRLADKLKEQRRVQAININERINHGEKPSNEYRLYLDAGRLALVGVDKAGVLNAIRSASAPTQTAGGVYINRTYYPVLIKEQSSGTFSNYDLLFANQAVDSNHLLRLNSVGSLVFTPAVNSIYKEGRQYVRVVSFEYLGLSEAGRYFLAAKLEAMKAGMPVGYTAVYKEYDGGWEWGGNNKIVWVALLLVAVFFITSIVFESLRKPLYVIAIIPVSFIGLFLTYYWGDFYLDQGGYAAFILLGSLVAGSSIFIINDLAILRQTSDEAYSRLLIRTLVARSETMFVTRLAVCVSMVPFLLEGSSSVFWFSFAVGAIGGLLFSLFSILVVLPVLLWRKGEALAAPDAIHAVAPKQEA